MKRWTRWQDWFNLVLGAWLFLSPWILASHTGSGAWDSWIFGVVVAIVSIGAAAASASRGVEWINVIFGVWIFIAPWILGFASRTMAWDSWIIGAAIVILSFWGMGSTQQLQEATR